MAARGADGEAGSVFRALRGLIDDLPGLISDRVHLLALELRRSRQALGQIVVLGLAAGLLGFTAWLAFWASVVGLMFEAGLHWAWAALGVMLVNLAAAAFAVARLKSLTPLLALPATMRHMTLAPAPDAALRDDEYLPAAVHPSATP